MLNWHSNAINFQLWQSWLGCQVRLGYWANGCFKIFRVIASITRLAQALSGNLWLSLTLPFPSSLRLFLPHCFCTEGCSPVENHMWPFISCSTWILSLWKPLLMMMWCHPWWGPKGSGLAEHILPQLSLHPCQETISSEKTGHGDGMGIKWRTNDHKPNFPNFFMNAGLGIDVFQNGVSNFSSVLWSHFSSCVCGHGALVGRMSLSLGISS